MTKYLDKINDFKPSTVSTTEVVAAIPTNTTQYDDEEQVANRLYATCLESTETGRGEYVVHHWRWCLPCSVL